MTSTVLGHFLPQTRLTLATSALAFLVMVAGCAETAPETLRFVEGATEVEVTFRGEVKDEVLFGGQGSVLDHIQPRDAAGRPRGKALDSRPGWLHFEYQIGAERREVLVAKQPVMNRVSWDDVARAGAALADGSVLSLGGSGAMQDARLTDAAGREYQVRLPRCGTSTLSDLSEWNLLVGAVHRGDRDFAGERYGWIRDPYDDGDLKVGYHGSLTWCQDAWVGGARVARGYFFVSRLHAAPPELRTDRLFWRPVLERVMAPAAPTGDGEPAQPLQWSPNRRVGYAGTVTNAELLGPDVVIGDLVPVDGGRYIGRGQPDWLRFVRDGRTLFVAAQPVKFGVSWDAIAIVGAALGDDSKVRVGWRTHRQDTVVKGRDGTRYRVRLLTCGQSTLDPRSEWNALIGGAHRGDGDFRPHPLGAYGWVLPAFDSQGLGIGMEHGGATWCQERIEVDGTTHAVNRGYLTVSRFHATEPKFSGVGFGWRPVLEAIP